MSEEPPIDLGARISSHGAAIGDPVFYVGSSVVLFVAFGLLAAVPLVGIVVIAATFAYGYWRRFDRDVQLVFHEDGIVHRVGQERRRVPYSRMRAIRIEKVPPDALLPSVVCAIELDDGTTLILSPHIEDLESHGKTIDGRVRARSERAEASSDADRGRPAVPNVE